MAVSALTKSLSALQPVGVFTFHKSEGNIKVLLLVKHLLQVMFFIDLAADEKLYPR